MSDATKNWLILLVGVLAVAMMFKTFLDVTGFNWPILSANSTSRKRWPRHLDGRGPPLQDPESVHSFGAVKERVVE